MLLRNAEKIAYKLPPLVVAALRTAETLTFGSHGRRRVGPGDSFFQYRSYLPGESTNRIDWRASARTDKIYIRETEWEAAQTIFFWADSSPSMHWKSEKRLFNKDDRAKLICLSLAALLLKGHELVGDLGGHMNPGRDPGSLWRLHNALTEHPTGNAPPLVELPRRTHIIAVGDFLMDAKAVAEWIGRMAAQGSQVVLVEIADPAEETFPYKGPTIFTGLEAEGDLTLNDPRDLRREYLEKRKMLRTALQETALRNGATYITHLTHEPVKGVLQRLYGLLGGGRT